MNLSRRQFCKTSLFAAPFFIGGCRSFFDGTCPPHWPAPSDRLTVGVIGCGVMAGGNMGAIMKDPRVRVVAVCDPIKFTKRHGYDGKSPGGRDHFKAIVDRHYGTKDCRVYTDWRDIVNDPTIDAVLVETSDVWHAIISIAAMKKGKHVFCQKPISLGVNEGKAMTRVAKETGVVFQVGSQQRSSPEFRKASELVLNGYLGDCKSCTIGLTYPHNDWRTCGYPRDPSRRPFPTDYFENEEMWNMWQGPAEHWENNAFIPGIHGPVTWRGNFRYGGGSITDWGAHHFDILQWAMGTDRSGPVAIENFWCDFQPPNSDVVDREVFDVPYRFKFDVVYGNGMRANVSDTTFAKQGLLFKGTEGKGDLFVTRGKIELPAHLKNWKESDLTASDRKLRVSTGSHEKDFVDAIYNGGEAACPCEVGHRSVTIAHLANICARLNLKGLKWDPVAERVTDNAEAQKLLDVPYHNGWSLEGNV